LFLIREPETKKNPTRFLKYMLSSIHSDKNPCFASSSRWTLLSFPSPAQDRQGADMASGQLAFNNACRTCHSVKEGDNRLGPNLYKVLGRRAGSLPNYGYSAAMKNADFVCDKGKLDQFIADPDAVVRDNRMKPYGGLASADTRAKVIAYLESVTAGQ
jgi:cytochrome c